MRYIYSLHNRYYAVLLEFDKYLSSQSDEQSSTSDRFFFFFFVLLTASGPLQASPTVSRRDFHDRG